MWLKSARYAQIILFSSLGIALFTWPTVSSVLHVSKEQILGVALALAAGTVLYFDKRIGALLSVEHQATHSNLADAITTALRYSPDPQSVRIWALSSFVIEALLQAMKPKIGKCHILIYEPGEGAPDFDNDSDVQMADLIPFNAWEQLSEEGIVQEYVIRTHSFYPSEYFILMDERVLIRGRYLIDIERFPRCTVQDPCVTVDRSDDGRRTIFKHIETFDNMWNSEFSKVVASSVSAEQ